jgi:hypothetical protein
VIVNVGDIDALYAQVDAVFEQLRRDRGPSGPPAPPPAGS